MKLNAPKQITFLIAVIVGVVGIIGSFISIPVISGIAFWLLAGGFVLLALSCVLKGL